MALAATTALLSVTPAAFGAADNVFLGNGHDGAFNAAATTVTLNSVAPVSGAVAVGASSLTRGTIRTGTVTLTTNRLVMVVQSTGYTGTVTTGNQSAFDLSSSAVGRWEFARISTIAGSTLNFTAPLINSYASGFSQVVAVPEYTNATVASGRTLVAQTWNGTSGGVLALLATGSVSLNGGLSATAKGFRGGSLVNHATNYACSDLDGNLKNAQRGEGIYPAGFGTSQVAKGNKTSGGGGGNCHNSGGAGGGHGGVGGQGSLDYNNLDNRAYGGAPLSYSPYNRALFGGGGGAGEENNGVGSAGGVGGGHVLVRGGSLSGSGTVSSTGSTPANALDDGAGGGGAGGSVYMRFTGAATCTINVSGGNGGTITNNSDGGPGGGGAGGVALIQGSPTNCPANVSNGTSGTAWTGVRGAGPTSLNSPGNTGLVTTNASAFSAPVSAVTVPLAGALTNDNTPTISGTATANATLDVYVDGTLNGSTTANGSGAWTYAPIVALTSGEHTTYVIPTYLGIVGTQSNSRSFSVDLVAPAAPSITTPSTNFVTTNTTPTIGGSAEANASVNVFDGATLLGTASANGSGVWSFTPPSPLTDAAHAITATATDAAGNTGAASATRTITVDTTTPGVVIVSPTEGQITPGETTAVSFTITDANPGSSTCSTDGGAFGSCSSPYAASTPTNGSHTVSVRHTDAVGNVATATRTFITDTLAPSVTISTPSAGQAISDSTPSVTFSATDLHLGAVTCAIDAGAFSACSSPYTPPALTDGPHSVTVRAGDAAGNTGTATRSFTIDTIAPVQPTITLPPADEVTSEASGPLAGGAEANSTVTGYLLGVAAGSTTANASGTWDFFVNDPYPEGTYSLTITATDAAGNVSVPSAPRVITIDTTTPVVSITAPTAGQRTLDPTPNITFSATDAHPGTTACSVDGGADGPCSSPFTTPTLPDGTHSVTVRHTDQAGNVGSASVSFVVDTLAPNVTISAPAQSATLITRTPNVVFTVADANPGTTTCSVDGGTSAACSSPFTTPTLGDGPHSVTVAAIDSAGNVGSAVRSFTIDATAPSAPSITTPGTDIATNVNRPTFAGGAEASSTVTIYDGVTLIGTVTAASNGSWTFTPVAVLSDGAHPITVRATDGAGNQGPASAVRTVTVDTATPAAPAITTPATDITTNNQAPALAGTAEADATVTILDGTSSIGTTVASAGGAWTFTPSAALNERAHTITVKATDAAGNQGPASSARTITIDVTTPIIAITAPTPGAALSTLTPNIVFAIAETNPGTTTCSVDGGGFSACSSPFTTPTLSQGPHSVTVRHTDAAGNVGNASRSFTVDTVAPAPPVFTVPPADTITSSASGSLEGTAEANSTFTLYYLGFPIGTAQTSAAGIWIFPSLGIAVDGVYTLSGTATDAAGNESAQSASRTITVDSTTPAVSITAPANGSHTIDSTPDVSFAVTDANPGTTACAVDTGAFGACSSPFTAPALTDGAHSVTVRHTDLAGNVGSAEVTLVIDTVLPVVTISAPAAGAALADNTPDVTFTVSEANPNTTTCAVDGGTAGPCSSPFTAPVLTDGPHSVTVTASDTAGNSASATRSFTIDTGTPAAPSITTPSTDVSTSNTRPSLAGSAEANSTVTIRDGAGSIGMTTADAGGAWSFTPVTALSSGAHVITATATDAAGHVSPASPVRTITVDTAAPSAPTITTPATDIVTSNQTPAIGGSAEAGSAVTIRDGAGSIGNSTTGAGGTWSFTPSAPLNEGAHSITATATDAAGNLSAASSIREITIDLTNPGVTISSPTAASSVSDTTPDVVFTISDPHPGASTCSVDGGGFSACSSPFTTLSLSQGLHSVTVRHTDAADNIGEATRSFTVDTIAPAPPVFTVPPADTITSSASGSLEGTAEANSTFTLYYLGFPTGTAQTSAAGSWILPSLGIAVDGVYTLSGTATDAAGNESTQSASRTITVDSTTPAVSITAPANGSHTIDSTPDVSFAVTDANPGTTQCSVDGAANSDCSSPFTAPTLSDGTHEVTVRHTDQAGNVGSASVTFIVDTVLPVVTISVPAEGAALADNTPDVTFAVSESHPGTTTCAVDGGGGGTCSSPFTAPLLADGPHSVTIRAEDVAGNAGSTTRSFTIDTGTPAAPSITTPAGNISTNDSTPLLAGTAEASSTVTINDGASPIGTTTAGVGGDWSFTPGTPLSSGAHTITATATDAAGHTSPASSSRVITVDTAAPAAPSITTPATDIVTSNQTPAIAGSAEANSTVTIRDGSSAIGTAGADGGGSWSFTPSTPLNQSVHAITATATDGAGNTGTASNTRTITVDTTNPSVTISSPLEGRYVGTATPAIAFNVSDLNPGFTACSVDGGVAGGCSSPFTTSSLADGPHYVTVTHTDLAGNSGSDTRNFNVDTTSPTVSITFPGESQSVSDTTPSVTFVITDASSGTSECEVDGGGYGVCSSPFTTPTLSQGAHTISVRYTDSASNVSTSTRNFIVDTIAPSPPVITIPPIDVITSDVSGAVVGTAEPLSLVTGYINGTPAGTANADASGDWSGSASVTLPDGVYSLAMTATDAAGNESAPSEARQITIDTTSPAVSITSPVNGTHTLDNTPSVSFTVSDANLGTTECSVDAGADSACSSPFTATTLSDGTHSVNVRHTDLAGNIGSASVSLVIDTVLPVVTISAPAEGAALADNTPDVTFTVSDANPGTTTCAVDGGVAGACSSPFTAPLLADGPHSVTVTASDTAGNSASATHGFTVDTGTPAAPSITTPATDISTSDTTPSLTGSAEAQSTVTVIDGTTPIGTATADGSGAWLFTPTTPLASGAHTLTATATDAAGHTSPASSARTITVDTSAPSAPSITTPATDTVTSNQTPVIAGSAEGGSLVTVRDGASAIGSATADGGGAWTFTPGTALNESDHVITATATDAAGNTGAASATRTIAVDITNPGVTISSPAAGSEISNLTPDVVFSISDQHPGANTCKVDGGVFASCSSPFTTPSLSQGLHSVTARHTDAAGNIGEATRSFTVDTIAPDTPTITYPPTDEVISYSTGRLAGGAEANSLVIGYLFGFPAGSTTTDGSGQWEFISSSPRPEGTYSLTITATDAAGNESAASAPRVITIDATPPSVLITSPANGSHTLDTTPDVAFSVTDGNLGTTECSLDGGAAGACASPFTTPVLSDGEHAVTVRHTDQAGNVGSASVTFVVDTVLPVVTFSAPAEGATLADNTPEFVFAVSDSNPNTTTCAVDGGTPASCASPFTASVMTDGPHSVTVSASDGAGNSGSATRNFTIDTAPPVAPSITTPATDVSTNDTTPSLTGSAEANSTVTVFDGANPLGNTIAGAGGDWSFTPATPLSPGSHAITAIATDAAGHASPTSGVRTITVDVGAPGAPTITTPAADIVTSIQAPAVAGNAEANSTVTVRDGTSSIGSVTADSGGAWSFAPSAPLNEGSHAITATATDVAGNTGAASAVRTITVDVTNPGVTIGSPAQGSYLGDPTPDVVFSIADQHPGSSECSVDGAASVPCSSPFTIPLLTDGPHSITVIHVDLAGNSASSTSNFEIDTEAPAAPTITNPPTDIVTSFSAGVLAGTAEAGSTLTGYLYGFVAGSTLTDATGHWEALTGASRPEGTYVITTTATDAAGNVGPFSESRTIVIDQTAPVVGITAPGAGAVTNDPTVDVSFDVTEIHPGSNECQVDDGVYVACVTPFTTAILPDGDHTVVVRHTDAALNVGSAEISFNVDTTSPVLTVTAPAEGQALSGRTPDIVFSVNDNHEGTTSCAVDGGAAATCSSPFTTPSLADGPHSVALTHTDTPGNAVTVVRSFLIDNAGPAAPSITTPAADTATNDTTPTLGGSAEARSTVSVSDGATVLGTTTTSDLGVWAFTPTAPLAEGAHSIVATATDPAGNTGEASAARTITIDTGTPDAPVINVPSSDLVTANQYTAITGSAEPNSDITILDGASTIGDTTTNGAGAWSYAPTNPFNEGDHPISVTATDSAGNTSAPSATRMIMIDITAPQVTITAPPEGQRLNDTAPTVTFITAEGHPLTTTCAVDGGPASTCTSPFSPAALTDGPHSVTVLESDAAGNTGAATVSFVVDTTAPETTIAAAPPVADDSNDATFVFVASEVGSSFECRLDGVSWVACTSPTIYEDLADGSHTFDVRATDTVGITDASPAAHSWSTDTTAPDAPVISSPTDPALTTDSTPTISGTAEIGSTVLIADSGATMGTTIADGFGDWSFTPTTSMPEGDHAVTATASDAVGNASQGSNLLRLTIDTTSPNTSIDSAPPSPTNQAISSFAFSSTESGATFECMLDGATWSACSSPSSFPGLVDGDHELVVRATDTAGNTDPTPITHQWSVDTTSPTAPTIESPADAAILNSETPTVSGSSAPGATINVFVDELLVGSTTATTGGTWTLTLGSPLSEGFHTLHALAGDAAGNISARSSLVDLSIDVTAPTGTVTRVPGGGEDGGPPSFEFATTDATATIECAVDNGSFIGCGSPYTPAAMGAGTHVLSVRFTDSAGNVTVEQAAFSVGVGPPTAPQCPTGMQRATRTVSITAVKYRHKKQVRVSVSSRYFVLAQVTLKKGSKRLAKQTLQITNGKTTFTLNRSNLRGASGLTLTLGATTEERGSFVLASNKLKIYRSGSARISPTSGSAGDCVYSKTPPAATVATTAGPRVYPGTGYVRLVSKSNEYVLSTIKMTQSGKTLGKNALLLSPGSTFNSHLSVYSDKRIRPGTVTFRTSNNSAGGAHGTTTQTIRVR